MKGKDKCTLLKQIRCTVARANNIDYAPTECTYQGECRGTCPKCEAELKYITTELEKIKRSGKQIAVAGVAAAVIATNVAGCKSMGTQPPDETAQSYNELESGNAGQGGSEQVEMLEGDVAYFEPGNENDGNFAEEKGNLEDDCTVTIINPEDYNDNQATEENKETEDTVVVTDSLMLIESNGTLTEPYEQCNWSDSRSGNSIISSDGPILAHVFDEVRNEIPQISYGGDFKTYFAENVELESSEIRNSSFDIHRKQIDKKTLNALYPGTYYLVFKVTKHDKDDERLGAGYECAYKLVIPDKEPEGDVIIRGETTEGDVGYPIEEEFEGNFFIPEEEDVLTGTTDHEPDEALPDIQIPTLQEAVKMSSEQLKPYVVGLNRDDVRRIWGAQAPAQQPSTNTLEKYDEYWIDLTGIHLFFDDNLTITDAEVFIVEDCSSSDVLAP